MATTVEKEVPLFSPQKNLNRLELMKCALTDVRLLHHLKIIFIYWPNPGSLNITVVVDFSKVL